MVRAMTWSAFWKSSCQERGEGQALRLEEEASKASTRPGTSRSLLSTNSRSSTLIAKGTESKRISGEPVFSSFRSQLESVAIIHFMKHLRNARGQKKFCHPVFPPGTHPADVSVIPQVGRHVKFGQSWFRRTGESVAKAGGL